MQEIESLKSIVKDVKESVLDAQESEVARCKQLSEQRAVVEDVFSKILAESTVTNDISQFVRKSVKRQKVEASEEQVLVEGNVKTSSETDTVKEGEIDNSISLTDSLEPESKKVKIDDGSGDKVKA